MPELVKKTFAAGMGAVFSTEEGIRKIAREVSLPEVVGYVASSADGAKDKVFEVVARETREFLSNLNLTEEIAKILTTLSFEIKTEIRFIPNSERFTGAEPDVKASVRLKRNDKAMSGQGRASATAGRACGSGAATARPARAAAATTTTTTAAAGTTASSAAAGYLGRGRLTFRPLTAPCYDISQMGRTLL